MLLSSMGNPKPMPVYWDKILINASQVTNPPIDPLREPMETRVFLGKKPEKIQRDENGRLKCCLPACRFPLSCRSASSRFPAACSRFLRSSALWSGRKIRSAGNLHILFHLPLKYFFWHRSDAHRWRIAVHRLCSRYSGCRCESLQIRDI